MFRALLAAVVAPLVSLVVWGVLSFLGILFTTQGKSSAASDTWVVLGSLAIGGFLGGCSFAAISRQFAAWQSLAWSALLFFVYAVLVLPTTTTGAHAISPWFQLPLALVAAGLSVFAGGMLCRPRSLPQAGATSPGEGAR